ncbi:MAG: toluene monooxygenase [Burkholderiaceae bacterium]|nr:MAG: toluene monooxygenase [Burkholderiaceae bacterium]
MNPIENAGFTHVGPVLESSETARGIVRAIQSLNPEVEIYDHGAYLRVLAPQRCVVTRIAIERTLGRTFHLPSDLECVMPSFKGQFFVNESEARWTAGNT